MKKSLIVISVIVLALTMTWVAYGAAGGGGGGVARGGGGGRGMMTSEEQMKVIAVIEQQVAAMKKSVASTPTVTDFASMTAEQRTQMREANTARQTAISTIMAQLAMLQGRSTPLAEGEQYILVSTAQLKTIQEAATKEKATETSAAITALMSGRGGGGGGRGAGGAGGARGGAN